MTISPNAKIQMLHFFTVGWLVFAATLYFTPLSWAVGGAVIGSAIKEFGFDHKVQSLQGQLEDFVFLCAGGVSAAFLLMLRLHFAMSGS